ncbi:MAG TPA: efflux RND transporter periplasmic adaptor subunit [Clostridia bacterium]|nr:efflux RND transporter periplasmic adaptor subunit [Clostridia bacterium]
MSQVKRRRILITMMVVVMSLLAVGCGSKTDEGELVKSIPVEVVEAMRDSVAIVDTVTGKIIPKREVPVVPKIGGKVERVAVTVGQKVQAGALLVQLETVDIDAQLRQTEAALEVARTNYDNLEVQLPNSLKLAQASFDAVQSNYDRMTYLFEQGGISEQQYEGMKTELEVAAINLDNAKAAQGQLDMAAAQVKQAEAAVDLVRTQLNNASITSPLSGTVTAVSVEPGHMAGPGMPVVTVARLDPVVAEFQLSEGQINKLKIGDQASIRVGAAGKDSYIGEVTEASPAADPRTKAYQVKVELPNEEGQLKAGMTAQVDLALEELTDALVVPVGAVVTKGNRQCIYLVDGEKAIECPVEVLLQDTEKAALQGDFKVGDRVVVAGQHLLQDGSPVKVVAGGDR